MIYPANRLLLHLNTPSFIFFKLLIFVIETHPAFRLYQHRLSPGWLRSRVDLSDHQYAIFRRHLSLLFGAMAAFTLISRLGCICLPYVAQCWFFGNRDTASSNSPVEIPFLKRLCSFSSSDPTNNLSFDLNDPPNVSRGTKKASELVFSIRRPILFICGTLFLVILHGANFLYIQAALLINFWLAQWCCTASRLSWMPVLTWLFAIASLFGSAFLAPWNVADLLPQLSFLVATINIIISA
jgi:hypothetical protein